MQTATVVTEFKELHHEGHIYKVGDTYPAEGFEADKERVAFLSEKHPKYGAIYLANVKVEEAEQKTSDPDKVQNEGDPEVFPKATGGGWYLLSNGEKVQGKEEAFVAEDALKSGE